MPTPTEKLTQDFNIFLAMGDELNDYLLTDTLFRTMTDPGLPKLTLGGYLMRQHRLAALANTHLTPTQQTQLHTVIRQNEQAIKARKTFFQKKVDQELAARLRQWSAYLDDAADSESAREPTRYRTAVEARLMLAAITDAAEAISVDVAHAHIEKIDALDHRLHQTWHTGPFILPDTWQDAYPETSYWWLYGLP